MTRDKGGELSFHKILDASVMLRRLGEQKRSKLLGHLFWVAIAGFTVQVAIATKNFRQLEKVRTLRSFWKPS
jgi:hypothetical protein